MLEEGGYSLSNRSNLSELIPFINQEEVNRVKEEISGKQVALIYDGTTHIAEALVINLRYVTGNWEIRQRVRRLKLLAKSLSGDELAHEIISCLSTELSIPSNLVVAAMRIVKIVYNQLLDIGCFSHALDTA